jgi:outer membrane biosynthesis protein TonB
MIKKLRWYNWTSIGMHLLLLLALVDIQFSPKPLPSFDTYEVDIVTDVPNAAMPAPNAGKAIPDFSRKSDALKSLDAIQKEKALPDAKAELMPSKIEPPKQEEQAYEPPQLPKAETPPRATAQPTAGPGRQGNPTDENAYLVGKWKSQVKGLVDRVWKTPPEIAAMDMSLKTTYILRISRTGDLLDRKLLISSGNSPFDRSIQLALGSLKRLPQPPLVLLGGQDSVEVTMSFTPPKGAQ